MRVSYFALVLVILLGAVACKSDPGPAPEDVWVGTIVSYSKAVSERYGVVGYVKEYEYVREGYEDPYRLYHVLDLDFDERGVVDQLGTARKFEVLPPEIARVRGVTMEEIPLTAQPLPKNVALILEVDDTLRIVPASPEDLKR